MKGLRLYKKEKLCSAVAIDSLFSRGSGASSSLAYPLRAVWRSNPGRRSDAPVAFVISVPKKRLRHAVDRVAMRRKIRESYRLNHQSTPLPEGSRLDVAFIYVADKRCDYKAVDRAMRRLLGKIAQASADAANAIKSDSPSDEPRPTD